MTVSLFSLTLCWLVIMCCTDIYNVIYNVIYTTLRSGSGDDDYLRTLRRKTERGSKVILSECLYTSEKVSEELLFICGSG